MERSSVFSITYCGDVGISFLMLDMFTEHVSILNQVLLLLIDFYNRVCSPINNAIQLTYQRCPLLLLFFSGSK